MQALAQNHFNLPPMHQFPCQRSLTDVAMVEHGAMENRLGTIVLVSDDEMLLLTRGLVLASAGFRVKTLSTSQAFLAPNFECDVLVICHSIRQEKARMLQEVVRFRSPGTQIVRLTYSEASEISHFKATWDPSQGPGQFLRYISEVTAPARATAAFSPFETS